MSGSVRCWTTYPASAHRPRLPRRHAERYRAHVLGELRRRGAQREPFDMRAGPPRTVTATAKTLVRVRSDIWGMSRGRSRLILRPRLERARRRGERNGRFRRRCRPGRVTFVLGDLVGSTRLWEYVGEMSSVLARLDQIIDERLGAHRGARPAEQGEGDNFVAVFARADAAAASFPLHAAGAIAGECRSGDIQVALRMALHTGDARVRDGGRYMGEALSRAAPVCAPPAAPWEDAGHLPC